MRKFIFALFIFFGGFRESIHACPALTVSEQHRVNFLLIEAAERYSWPDSVKEMVAQNAGFVSWTALVHAPPPAPKTPWSRQIPVIGALEPHERMNPWEAFYQRHLRNMGLYIDRDTVLIFDQRGQIVEWHSNDEDRVTFTYDSIGNVSAARFATVPNAPEILVDDFRRIDEIFALVKRLYLSNPKCQHRHPAIL